MQISYFKLNISLHVRNIKFYHWHTLIAPHNRKREVRELRRKQYNPHGTVNKSKLKTKPIKQRTKFLKNWFHSIYFQNCIMTFQKKIAVLINLKSLWGLPTKQEPYNYRQREVVYLWKSRGHDNNLPCLAWLKLRPIQHNVTNEESLTE